MLKHLLSPTRIGSLELRNRIAMAPMGVDIVEADGHVREPTIRYYAERARGGVGLLITENTAAAYPRGANSAHEIGVSSDAFLPGLSRLTKAVHEYDAKIAIQLAHHGKVARLDTQQGREILMPSIPTEDMSLDGPLDLTRDEMGWMAKAAGGAVPRIREAKQDDIEELIEDFASAADRARRAGFDAVELHGAHGYIFSEFLSPAWNFREDEYGGSIENRARLLCDVLRACKRRTGEDFPIWCRIDAVEFGITNGIRIEDAAATAKLLEAAGADAIHMSAYANPLGAGFTEGPIVHREGGFVDFAAHVKAEIELPVIVAGRIGPELGDRVIRDGQADLISMGRQLLADPETVAKLESGRATEIRPCIYCNVCVAQPFFDRKVRCSVNPAAAEEERFAELLRTTSNNPKRIVVVGGGPAGLEAASIAAMRGHQVTLFEKGSQLGGTLRFAALTYSPNEKLLDWLEARARSLPIEIRLGEEATPEVLRELAPDLAIAAVGAIREKSTIPGADLDHVWDGDHLRDVLTGAGSDSDSDSDGGKPRLSLVARVAIGAGRLSGVTSSPSRLRQASRLYMPMGRRVAVIGGGLVGLELAEFFAERGREVAVFEEGPIMGVEMAHPRRWRVLFELRKAGVRLESNARVLAIEASSLRFVVGAGDERSRPAEDVEVDSIVIATGLAANPKPIEALETAGVPVVVVGDANGVGYIEGAIHQGFNAAINL